MLSPSISPHSPLFGQRCFVVSHRSPHSNYTHTEREEEGEMGSFMGEEEGEEEKRRRR